jgi:hypothetical protein
MSYLKWIPAFAGLTAVDLQELLKAELWVKAHIRRCHANGIFAALVRRGDERSGTVLIKLNPLNGNATVLSRAFDGEGNTYWQRATGAEPVSEIDADGYIEKQLNFDRDLWVLEIEDAAGRHLLDEPVR